MMTSNTKNPPRRWINYLVLFVVIVVGIVSGAYITRAMGLTGFGAEAHLTPDQLLNHSSFQAGTMLPLIPIGDPSENHTLDEYLGTKAIVAFVSGGCKACSEFIENVEKGNVVPDGCTLILLTPDPNPYNHIKNYPILTVAPEVFEELGIITFPTILGLGADAKIKLVSSGYLSQLDKEFFNDNL
ncbi:MAG: hypothetical protein R3F48_14320 [Candidatus Zixiibacteriota bacterium]